jgi:hypothetical protein
MRDVIKSCNADAAEWAAELYCDRNSGGSGANHADYRSSRATRICAETATGRRIVKLKPNNSLRTRRGVN